jgi:hypothetical protein
MFNYNETLLQGINSEDFAFMRKISTYLRIIFTEIDPDYTQASTEEMTDAERNAVLWITHTIRSTPN